MFTKEFKNEKNLFEGYSITNSDALGIAVAKKEIILPKGIILPEKKIILLDEANENEKVIINSITRGGIILWKA